ncbi:MAG TPA: hypothetical protein VI520_06205 [Anaerolineales bacterium]|jgi:cytochrome bd-type quinol oxidase subunit 1|nr:hypothetical protein [Anaerolineales bacterium]
MLNSPQTDAFSGLIILVLLGLGLVILFAVMLLESLVLRRLGWGSIGRCLVDSFVMNLASALVGVILGWVLRIDLYLGRSSGLVGILLLASLALSVIVEAGLISMVRKREFGETLRPVLRVNVASYALLVVLIAVSNIRRV